MRRQRGFTLVEIAIVTIIVALLIGGVLRGQEMVAQARTKSLVSDFVGITAAVQAYQDRYRYLPGDDAGGAARWGSYNAKSGTGDGTVSGLYNDPVPPGDPATSLTVDASGGESLNFWWHLRIAGFVAGPQRGPGAANQPDNVVGGILGVQTGNGPANFLSGLIACTSNVLDKNASGVEAQLDDLIPGQGQVRSLLQQTGKSSPTLTDPSNSTPANYVEGVGNRYLVCRSI